MKDLRAAEEEAATAADDETIEAPSSSTATSSEQEGADGSAQHHVTPMELIFAAKRSKWLMSLNLAVHILAFLCGFYFL